MAKLETTQSKRPSSRPESGLAKSWATMETRPGASSFRAFCAGRESAKRFSSASQHGEGKIHGHKLRLRTRGLHQRQQPSAAAADIQNAPGIGRHELQQRGLALDAVRNGIRPAQ